MVNDALRKKLFILRELSTLFTISGSPGIDLDFVFSKIPNIFKSITFSTLYKSIFSKVGFHDIQRANQCV